MPEKIRLLFDFSPENYKRLEEICKKAGNNDKEEVIKDALRLYEWCVTHMNEGWKLRRKRGELYQQIRLTF